MKLSVTLLVFVITTWSLVQAQNSTLDSLIQELTTSQKPIKYQLDLYYQIAKAYQDVDLGKSTRYGKNMLEISERCDSLSRATFALDLLYENYEKSNQFEACVDCASKAVVIAKKLDKPWDVAYFQSQLGNAQIKLGNYYDALENYTQAVKYAGEHPDMVKYQVAFLTNIGGIYHYLGDDLKALDYFLQSYNMKKEHGLTDNLCPSLINIASVYGKLKKYKEAIEIHEKARQIARETGDNYYQMKALTGLGFDYYLLKDYERSINFYLLALSLSDTIRDFTSKANILAKLSNAYNDMDKPGKAFAYAKNALDLSRDINYSFGISSSSRTLSEFYRQKKDYSQAILLLEESINTSKKAGTMENLKDAYFSISTIYENLNDPSNALKYYKLYSTISDSLLKHEEGEKFNMVQIKYQMEAKGREVENLMHENEIKSLMISRSKHILWGLIILFTMILIFLFLLIRQNKFRNRQKQIILEQQLLRSQMNPHFIFNTLTAIQKYIHDKSSLIATDYLGRFGKLMRFILHSSHTEKIAFESELDFLENYIKLQALRFENAFDYELTLDPTIVPGDILIAPMMIQPFVENAIEHGLRTLNKKGLLIIRFKLMEEYLHVEVEDNGIGREKSGKLNLLNKPGHKSKALEIVSQRLTYLNKTSHKNIKFEIVDLYSQSGKPSGTRVIINLPIVWDF